MGIVGDKFNEEKINNWLSNDSLFNRNNCLFILRKSVGL